MRQFTLEQATSTNDILFPERPAIQVVASNIFADDFRSGMGVRSAVGSDQWSELGMVATGVAVVVVLTSIPIIGPLVKLCVALLALGALWLMWRASRMTARRIAPSEPVPPAPPASAAR